MCFVNDRTHLGDSVTCPNILMFLCNKTEAENPIVIMGPSFLEGGPIMYQFDAVRPSVRPVPPPREKTKRPTNTKLGRKDHRDTSTPWTNFKVKGSKVKVIGHGSCVNVSLIIRPSNVGYRTSASGMLLCHREQFTGCEWFTRWQHLMLPCGSMHVVNCKDGPIAGSPSTAAHSCFSVHRHIMQLLSWLWWIYLLKYPSYMDKKKLWPFGEKKEITKRNHMVTYS